MVIKTTDILVKATKETDTLMKVKKVFGKDYGANDN